jgi:hypothetical protein
VLALAEHAIAESPPRAGATAGLPRTIIPAPAAADGRPLDADAVGQPRPHARHGGRARPTAFMAQAAVASTCALESEALGLCTRAQTRAPAPAAPPAPLREPSRDAVRPAPACDPTRAALALCPAGGGAGL